MSNGSWEAPFKIMINDISQLRKCENAWSYNCDGESRTGIKLNKVHVQGKICKTAGFLKEILIVSDGTGKAKVTRSRTVPGDLSWIDEGVSCSIIGSLVDNGKLPHIDLIKIAKLTNPILEQMWPLEVVELKNLLLGKLVPRIT